VAGLLSFQNDPELVTSLDDLAGHRANRIAVAVVDLDPAPHADLALINADATTQFEIGSITKPLTGMLLADAVTYGKLSLDTEVGDIVPSSQRTALGTVTLLELATHTSGLPRMPQTQGIVLRALPYLFFGLNPYRGTMPATVIRLAERQHLHGRGQVRYSNLGGALLGQLLAVAESTQYPSLVSDRILRPLGITSSAVATKEDHAGWGRSSLGLPRQPWVMGGYAPAGGVFSTIGDMARLACALLDGTAPGVESLDPVDGVAGGRPNRRSGLFWIIDEPPGEGRTTIWHNGGTGGYSSILVLIPSTRRAVVILEGRAGGAARLKRIADQLAT